MINIYRTHNCADLNINHVGKSVKLSGWIYRKRDHGGIIFLDLRDHYGVTQLVFNNEENSDLFNTISAIRIESVITVEGSVISRDSSTVNKNLPTGEIEVLVSKLIIQSEADVLPMMVTGEQEYPEETRLHYRFLDLRREKVKNNIILRSNVISELRHQMMNLGFLEIQTPILTASSPEGARDYLVPSRVHPGKFYALPQAPQQFKQLLMVSGFDKYFQIAPCFRDEDARADRSPGEFYQLDVEMSFVTQEDVFSAIEPTLYNLFVKFTDKKVERDFPRITYAESMLKYGSDKPDLRNPIIISDVTDIFKDSEFKIFKNNIESGMIVRAIPAPNTSDKPRSFFDQKIEEAKNLGAQGLGYITFDHDGSAKGPIAKFLKEDQLNKLKDAASIKNGDSVFFASDFESEATKLAGEIRKILGDNLNLIDHNIFKFCWILDFPYYFYDEKEKKIDFFHNPFSMPQGGMEALLNQDPLKILAYQYDIVCNGVELSSGAIRNHKPEIMYKAFEIAGYNKDDVDEKFGAMIRAFKFGAPPHGGIAPGVDRIVMLLANEPNIREVICFPLNQKGEDLLMGAPSEVLHKHLSELHIKLTPVK